MGYETLLEQIKAVFVWNSLRYRGFITFQYYLNLPLN